MLDLEQIKSISELNYKIAETLILYRQLAIFLGSFLFAESVIFTASFLSAQGFWPLTTVFIFVFLGAIISDFFWYFGRLFFLKFTRQWLLYKNAYNKLSAFVDKITYNKPFLALLFMKFLYGTRFLIIIYIAMRQVKLKTFLFYDIIGTIIWLLVIIPIGWLAGKGAYNIIPIYKNIGYSIFILILSFVIFKLISRWLKNKITDAK